MHIAHQIVGPPCTSQALNARRPSVHTLTPSTHAGPPCTHHEDLRQRGGADMGGLGLAQGSQGLSRMPGQQGLLQGVQLEQQVHHDLRSTRGRAASSL